MAPLQAPGKRIIVPSVKQLIYLSIGLAAIALVGCSTQRSQLPTAPPQAEGSVPTITQGVTPGARAPEPAPTAPATLPEVDPPATTPTSIALWQRLPQQTIDGRAFRQYATVNRTDGTYRTMYIDEATLAAWVEGQPLPEGALFVMETYLTPGNESTNFIKALGADGRFIYGSFSPSRPLFATRADNSCTSCHRSSIDLPGTFTLPMLEAAVAQGLVMGTTCDQGGRTPCGPETYEQFSPLGVAPSSECLMCHTAQQEGSGSS